ncbi:DUF4234 domain-containing protein [Parasporobacterium paucivorans]|uniref:DUF4234 domain-containing protein n=1 Tax=Parasporobacterium paucivorans DSM 15970 TaxID=1122934 RepID=A0A1M6IB30_9FIRM|nr:DUF4234 domain-containing protein [Parasporobacterium paucivorans]SHJ31578.1 protein of unknown function [Parasporobacterium paucivorans DSM 15970]
MVMKRSIALCIIFTIITCGIYGMYWQVILTDDTNTLADEPGTSGIMALIFTIITCGIYGLYWAYKRGELIDRAKLDRGIPASNGGVLYLIVFILGGIIAYALIQNEINNLQDYGKTY